MNCSQARPLLLAGDIAADAHLEGCLACGRWLEVHDPLVSLIRQARPDALPVPAGLRRGVLTRWSPQTRGLAPIFVLGGSTAGLLIAAMIGVFLLRQDLVARAADLAAPILHLFQAPRELMLDNLPALVLALGLGTFAMAMSGVIYRDLGQTARRTA